MKTKILTVILMFAMVALVACGGKLVISADADTPESTPEPIVSPTPELTPEPGDINKDDGFYYEDWRYGTVWVFEHPERGLVFEVTDGDGVTHLLDYDRTHDINKTTEMPNLIGLDSSEVRSLLIDLMNNTQVFFTYEFTYVESEEDRYIIVETEPIHGAELKSGDIVIIKVSEGPKDKIYD